MTQDRDPVIIAAVRTPIARFLGGLKSIRADDLAATVIRAVCEKAGVDGHDIGEVVMGCANQAGEDNRNVARMALLLAGLPQSVPGITLNRLCASGLDAINYAGRMIQCGEADVMVAGGVENMSRAPWVMPKPVSEKPVGNRLVYDSALGWRFPNPKLEALFPLEAMGATAENIVERYGISREEQDAFALHSHQKAHAAWEEGRMGQEVIGVEIPQRKGAPLLLDRDEGIRPDSSLETLGRLRPAFREGGSVTAGNSSTLNDGACALVLALATSG